MIVVDLRRPFQEPEIAALFHRDRSVVERLILLDAPVRQEKPHLVACDWTADRQIGLIVLAAIGRNSLHVRVVEFLRNHEQRGRAVKTVAAAFRHDVHELPDHARPVGCFSAEGLHFHVLNRVVVQVHGENVAAVRVGDVGAVEARAPLRSGQLLCGRIDRHARHDEPRILEAAVGGDRHGCERLIIDVDRQPRPFGVDDRRFRAHRHLFGDRSDRHREVDFGDGVETHRRLANDRLKAGELGPHLVGGGR